MELIQERHRCDPPQPGSDWDPASTVWTCAACGVTWRRDFYEAYRRRFLGTDQGWSWFLADTTPMPASVIAIPALDVWFAARMALANGKDMEMYERWRTLAKAVLAAKGVDPDILEP